MRATAVIGANFGDEGKGKVVDWITRSSEEPAAVVRFNGGAQAGHTVHTGRVRHVFHHFGSGTLAGASTVLSQFFVVNPVLFMREYWALVIERGLSPRTYIHPGAVVTVPLDMMLNQAVERRRGDQRHGSCGIGINETLVRSETEYGIRAADLLLDISVLADKLSRIDSHWAPHRADALGVPVPPARERRHHSGIFLDALKAMRKACSIADALPGLARSRRLIFEGAQGLLLDKAHPFFPHVTPSKTGLANVLSIAHSVGIDEISAFYVTRPYMTRHGSGPFPTETGDLSFDDATNRPHPFQGSLRFGLMDVDGFDQVVNDDIKSAAGSGVSIRQNLAITCVDQIYDDLNLPYRVYGETRTSRGPDDIIMHLQRRVDPNILLVGTGPEREAMYAT